MEKQEVLTNPTYYLRCLNILYLAKGNKKLTRKEIFQFNNETQTSKYMLELLKFLEEYFFIKVNKERVPYVYHIEETKLADFLCKSQWYDKFGCVVESRTKVIPYSY